MSKWWLAAGLVIAVPVALLATFTLASWAFRSTTTGAAAVAQAPARVVVDGSGDVRVVAASDRRAVSLRWTGRYFIDEPDLFWHMDGDTLIVRGDCGGVGWLTNCSIDVTLELPAGSGLAVDTSSGDVDVEGDMRELALTTSSGDVVVRGASPVIAADTRSGDVTIDTTSRRLTAGTHSGDVDVSVSGGPPEHVEATSGSGDVDITVPYAAYDVAVDTGSGDETVDGIVQDGRAARTIVAGTGSGDVTIAGR